MSSLSSAVASEASPVSQPPLWYQVPLCITKVGLNPLRIFLLSYLKVNTLGGERSVVSDRVMEGYAGVWVCWRRGWAWAGAEEEKLENPQFQQTVGPQFQQTQSLKTPTFGVYFFFPQVIFTLKKKCKKENKNIKLLPVSLRGNPYEQFAVYHCWFFPQVNLFYVFYTQTKNKTKQKWGRGINIDQSLAFFPHQYIMDIIQVSMYGSTSFLNGHRVSIVRPNHHLYFQPRINGHLGGLQFGAVYVL